LNAEKGRSVEVGVRAELFKRQIRLNVAAYDFRLRETIVVRRDANDADYFVNAGTTSQKGIESTIAWTSSLNSKKFEMFRLWMSYTYTDYHFLDYVSGPTDFSGNRLTGVPPTVVVSGLDIMTKRGWYANITLNYTDHIPVNDGNTEFAHEYKVFSARAGKRFDVWRFKNMELFAGVDNAFNEKYSLGNDLNAAGGRYYNVAPGRNFYGGLTIPFGSN
jgi:iron complex outermembrane receptor protein